MQLTNVLECSECVVGKVTGAVAGRCHFATRQVARDEIIFEQGQPADAIWVIKDGTVLLSRASSVDGTSVRAHAIRKPGDLIGLEGLIRPTYADQARAITPLTLCGARREHIDRWLGPPGTPARAVLEQTVRMMSGDPPRAAGSDGSAVRRLARWLVAESEQGRAPAIPRQVLADLLGMVPETLSRSLAELARSGAVNATRRHIVIASDAALRVAAGL